MSPGRSESAGLCELRKQLTETKEGSLELRKKKDKEDVPGRRRGGKTWHAPERERKFAPWGKKGWRKPWACSKENELTKGNPYFLSVLWGPGSH